MKKVFLNYVFICISMLAMAQTTKQVPRLEKTPIENSGCFAYLPKSVKPIEFQKSKSEDGADIYTAEVKNGDHVFSIIFVNLGFTIDNKPQQEELLISYMDHLKESFEIVESAGYGKGHTLKNFPKAVGVLDYWEDEQGEKYVVKSWQNDTYLAVMMLSGAKEYPYFNVQEMFLNGIVFK